MREGYDDRYGADHESNGQTTTTTASASASQDDEDDDNLVVCRCETPKILYDLLQSFSKHGSSSNSNSSWSKSFGTSRFTAGTQQEEGSTLHKLHPMTFFCTKSGLTIHSQSSNKQFQASMELPASLFCYYRLMEPPPNEKNVNDDDDDDISYDFTIHWQTFMQCLNVLMIGTGGDRVPSVNPVASFFGNHHQSPKPHPTSSLTLSYHTSTEVLRLEWEGSCDTTTSSSVVATAAIPGLNPPPADQAAELSAAFGQSPIAARWLCPMASHEMSETKELEYLPGATTVRVRFLRQGESCSSDDDDEHTIQKGPRLKLSARGHSGRVTIEIPAPIEFMGTTGDDTNSKGSAPPGRNPKKIARTYSLAGWQRALQPLDMARETCLSVNTRGILAIQHQLIVDTRGNRSKNKKRNQQQQNQKQNQNQPPPKDSAFCDFLLLPLEVDEDKNDEDESDQEQSVGTNSGYSDSDDDNDNDNDNDNNNDDGRRTSMVQKSTQGSALSQATTNNNVEDEDEDEDDFGPSMVVREKRRRRTILSASQDTATIRGDDDDDDDETTKTAARFSIGSDNEEDEEAVAAPAKRNLLFPTVTDGGGGDNTGSRSGSNHHTIRRERERRKRQRRSQLSNLTSSILSVDKGEDEIGNRNGDRNGEEEVDTESQAKSVNLLDDVDSNDSGGNGSNGDNDDDRYCSSPELVYGQQG